MAETDGIALISNATSRTNKCQKWFIDSAATKHMKYDQDILVDYEQYKQPTNIYLGDNTAINAMGEGHVKLRTTSSGHDVMLDLHKVLFVPDMALMGAEIRFNRNECVVLKGGKEFVIGNLIDNKLYTVNMGLINKVDMVCLSPVGYGVQLTFRALALRRSLLRRRANSRNVS